MSTDREALLETLVAELRRMAANDWERHCQDLERILALEKRLAEALRHQNPCADGHFFVRRFAPCQHGGRVSFERCDRCGTIR